MLPARAGLQRLPRLGGDLRVPRQRRHGVPLLAPGFDRYFPLLNAWWLLAFALDLVVLRRGRWTRPTRWADFGLEVANALILLAIVTGPPVSQYDRPIGFVVTWFVVFSVVSASVMLYRLLRRRPVEPWAKA